MNEIEKAYWAGFIDGEGSIRISKVHSGLGTHKTPTYVPRISVGNTNKQALNELKQFIGCGRVYLQRPAIGRQKTQFFYEATHRNAEHLIKKVLPYLRLKKTQAELLLGFIKEKANRKNSNRGTLTKEELKKREQFYKQMKLLNI